MKKNLLLIGLSFWVASFFSPHARAQFAMDNIDLIDKLKTSTTYIVMSNPDEASSKEFVEVYKKYWTFSKIEFISYAEVPNYLNANSFFFSIGGYQTSSSLNSLYSSPGGVSPDYTTTHLYLELWTCSADYLSKEKRKPLKRFDQKQLARIELYTDFLTLGTPKLIYTLSYDGQGHIRNWGPGFLKCYLQKLMYDLEHPKKTDQFAGIFDLEQLKSLKNQTLYLSEDVLIKFNKFSGDESKRFEPAEIMEGYPYKAEIIGREALNKKIMTDKEPFYYLVYVKSCTDKFVTIINSKTGEVIYTTYTPLSYNFKNNDLTAVPKRMESK